MTIAAVGLISACTTTDPVEEDRTLPIGSPDSKLAGTSWQWSVDQGPKPYIKFLANGHIRGSTGCNSISGVYQETTDVKYGRHYFSLGDIISTEMACPSGMDTESTFLKALSFADSFSQAAEQLTLHDEDGTIIVGLDPKTD